MDSIEITFRSEDDGEVFQVVVPTTAPVSAIIPRMMEEILIPPSFINITDDQGSTIPLQQGDIPLAALGVYDGSIFTFSDKRLQPVHEQEMLFVQSLGGQFQPELANFIYVRPPLFRYMLQLHPEWASQLSTEVKDLLKKKDEELISSLEAEHYKISPEHRRQYFGRQLKKMRQNGVSNEKIEIMEKKLQEIDNDEAIENAYYYSMEHDPASFIPVDMLYVEMEVNGKKMKAFVDSGAQSTIMSDACARACGLSGLIDTRYKGVARGVGSSNILGRIHAAKVKLGSQFISSYFTVIEGLDTDILLGLDQLRKHQMSIDLKKNALVLEGESIPFLASTQIPKNNAQDSEMIKMISPNLALIKTIMKKVLNAKNASQ